MGLFDRIKNMFTKEETKEVSSNQSNIEKNIDDNILVDNSEVEKVNNEKVKFYEKGLSKSRKGFVSNLISLTSRYNKVNEEYFDELEEILIMADIGVNTVMEFMDRLRERVRREKIDDPNLLKEVIVDELFIIYVNDDILESKIHYSESGPTVLLFVGVNGVGKTTTIGKLAWKMIQEGKKVLLVAGDTFRAGATKQLEEWANKIGAGFYGKEEGSDPASVVYDGLEIAKNENYDVVFIDTAGRLQNKVNLMKELEKVNRVIDTQIPGAPHETLLVIDATTGQNAISQVKAFKEQADITGIVLTKLDGTAKGGAVVGIVQENDIPVKFIGVGEQIDDMEIFNSKDFVKAII